MNIQDIIQLLFHQPVTIRPVEVHSDMMNFMASRKLYSVQIGNVEFVAIELRSNETFSIVSLKKQMDEYTKKIGKNCAYAIDWATRPQLDAFIRNSIPFVSGNKQVYLPFLGVVLSNEDFTDSKHFDTQRMMPATQLLFLYVFYNQKERFFLKSKVAEKLNLTKTSMTRASEQLIGMRLITQQKVGREYRMTPVAYGSALYEMAKDLLINPVADEFYIDSEQLNSKRFLAGESALSECSMLNPPEIPCFALCKEDDSARSFKRLDIRWERPVNPAKIQLWKYDPALFAKDDLIDKVSMICSFKGVFDERIESEINEIVEKGLW